MGLRDDDERLFAERDLLDWAREAPRSPGDYDHAPSEEESAAYEYDRRKWMEKRPTSLDNYEEAHPSVGGYRGGHQYITDPRPKPVSADKTKTKKPVARKIKTGRKGRQR